MDSIVEIQISRLADMLKDRGFVITLDKKAKTLLANKGYDPVYGARPLKRVIQQELQNVLAEKILKGEIKEGNSIKISAKSDEFVVG